MTKTALEESAFGNLTRRSMCGSNLVLYSLPARAAQAAIVYRHTSWKCLENLEQEPTPSAVREEPRARPQRRRGMLRGAGDTERTFLLPSSLKVSPFKRDRRDQRNKQTHIHIHTYTHTHSHWGPATRQPDLPEQAKLKNRAMQRRAWLAGGVEECGPVHRPHQSRFPPTPSLAKSAAPALDRPGWNRHD